MRAARLLPLLLALPPGLMAQAWLPAQGDGSVSILYQYDISRLHSYEDGRTNDRGHTYFDAMIVNTDFSLTDRLAIQIGLPFVEARYVGPKPHLLVRGDASTEVAIDNGNYHGGFQDFRFNVRYALSRRALKITPFVEAILPSHAYSSFGHAAIGLNEHEYRMGVSVGRRLNPILPKAFVQGQYAFGFTPYVAAGIAPRRSYGELQLGYLLSRRISFQGSSALTWSHNGLDYDINLFPTNLTNEQYLNHDRIAQSKLLDAGGSVSYLVNKSTNFFVSVSHSFYGTNGHLRYVVTTVGFTKAFTTASEKASVLAALPEANKAMVCTCAKTK
jgi:hypothetical protein